MADTETILALGAILEQQHAGIEQQRCTCERRRNPVPHESGCAWLQFVRETESEARGCSDCAAKVGAVRKVRIDAAKPERDQHLGIRMLRVWLRGLHMRMVGGWDQDTSQDDIAELLGEHPRGHEHQFEVDPGRDS